MTTATPHPGPYQNTPEWWAQLWQHHYDQEYPPHRPTSEEELAAYYTF